MDIWEVRHKNRAREEKKHCRFHTFLGTPSHNPQQKNNPQQKSKIANREK
jgi:hypothetical protein